MKSKNFNVLSVSIFCLFIMLIALTACGRGSATNDAPTQDTHVQEPIAHEYEPTPPSEIYPTEPSDAENATAEPETYISPAIFPQPVYSGFVDERFELISLIFRLAGRPEHGNTFTPFQQQLSERFSEFRHHGAVGLARSWGFGFDAVLAFAVHMEWTENGFVLIDTKDALAYEAFGRWDRTRAENFLIAVNDFYLTTDFAAFFRENVPYFLEHSERFRTQLYDNLNKDWFYPHGIHPDIMRAVISPATSQNGYASRIFDDNGELLALYAAIPGTHNFSGFMPFMVHEFVHGFANNIAAEWYAENEIFRQMSTGSIDLIRMPFYPTGLIMGFEYVTRAYTILYMVENEGVNPIFLLLNEKAMGFPNIGYVYAMITGEYLLGQDMDLIRLVLDTDYEIMDEQFTYTLPRGVIHWHFVDLLGAELDLTQFTHSTVGNIFNTGLGDVIYFIDADGNRFLHIDIGPGGDAWGDEFRSYVVFPLGQYDYYRLP